MASKIRYNSSITMNSIKRLFFVVLIFYVNSSFSQNKLDNDSVSINLKHKIETLKKDVCEIKDWQISQKELTNLTNERIKDNLAQSERLFSYTSIGISIFAFIVTVMNIILFVWIFLVQRNLKQETKEINADTKKSRLELDEMLNKKSDELARKTEELYSKMLNAKYGQYDKKLRDEIINEEEYQKFEDLDNFRKKIFRAEKELDENNLRDAINHFSRILEEETQNRDYLYNKIGIAYTKLGATTIALEYFKKAFNATTKNKKKYVMNLLEQNIILGNINEVNELIKYCDKSKIDKDSLPVYFTLKFAFYVKTEDTLKLNQLKEQQKVVNWNQDSNWEFKSLKDCFRKEFADDFNEIFRFANLLYVK